MHRLLPRPVVRSVAAGRASHRPWGRCVSKVTFEGSIVSFPRPAHSCFYTSRFSRCPAVPVEVRLLRCCTFACSQHNTCWHAMSCRVRWAVASMPLCCTCACSLACHGLSCRWHWAVASMQQGASFLEMLTENCGVLPSIMSGLSFRFSAR